jgi:hypothetical protein
MIKIIKIKIKINKKIKMKELIKIREISNNLNNHNRMNNRINNYNSPLLNSSYQQLKINNNLICTIHKYNNKNQLYFHQLYFLLNNNYLKLNNQLRTKLLFKN